jgi:hypothetical protein
MIPHPIHLPEAADPRRRAFLPVVVSELASAGMELEGAMSAPRSEVPGYSSHHASSQTHCCHPPSDALLAGVTLMEEGDGQGRRARPTPRSHAVPLSASRATNRAGRTRLVGATLIGGMGTARTGGRKPEETEEVGGGEGQSKEIEM